MATARTVIDVVLSEARAKDYEDMLAIASVIANRAQQLGVTQQQVVSVQSEFNAYGRAIPKSLETYRDMAKKAVAEVKAKGPVHNATFFATPKAAKGLPKDLVSVTRTKGHNYYRDPKNRSIRTAAGFKTPKTATQQLASLQKDKVAIPTPSPKSVQVASMANDLGIMTPAGVLPGQYTGMTVDPASFTDLNELTGPSITGQEIQRSGTRATNPGSFAPGNISYDHPERGHWSKDLQPGLVDQMETYAALQAMSGLPAHVNSAHRSAAINEMVGGARASNHITGGAIDFSRAGLDRALGRPATDEEWSASLQNQAIAFGTVSNYGQRTHVEPDIHSRNWTGRPNITVPDATKAAGRLAAADYLGQIPAPTPSPLNVASGPSRSDKLAAAIQAERSKPSNIALDKIDSHFTANMVAPNPAEMTGPMLEDVAFRSQDPRASLAGQIAFDRAREFNETPYSATAATPGMMDALDPRRDDFMRATPSPGPNPFAGRVDQAFDVASAPMNVPSQVDITNAPMTADMTGVPTAVQQARTPVDAGLVSNMAAEREVIAPPTPSIDPATAYGQYTASMQEAGVPNLSGFTGSAPIAGMNPEVYSGLPTLEVGPVQTVGRATPNVEVNQYGINPQQAYHDAIAPYETAADRKAAAEHSAPRGIVDALFSGLVDAIGGKKGIGPATISRGVNGMLDALGGFGKGQSAGYASRGTPGGSYGGYGDGGGFGAQSYGYGGDSGGMGGYEQFGDSYQGPGSGGWADAGQGFGQGSAADIGT